MSEVKKSFIVYTDWKETFDSLPDDIAGQLIKHIFAYNANENPVSDSIIINAVFANIKNTLHRDFVKYERRASASRSNGAGGGRPSKPKKPSRFKNNLDEPRKPVNDNDNVNDNVNDSVNDSVNVNDSVLINKKKFYSKILSATTVADVPEGEVKYFKISKLFWELFVRISTKSGNPTVLLNAKNTWTRDIRLMMEVDKVTPEQFRVAYDFIESTPFWQGHILSTKKLREKLPTILLQANGKKNNKTERAASSNLESKKNAYGKILGFELQ